MAVNMAPARPGAARFAGGVLATARTGAGLASINVCGKREFMLRVLPDRAAVRVN